jgi:hypothetical protein
MCADKIEQVRAMARKRTAAMIAADIEGIADLLDARETLPFERSRRHARGLSR